MWVGLLSSASNSANSSDVFPAVLAVNQNIRRLKSVKEYCVPARDIKYGGSSPRAVPIPQNNASSWTTAKICQSEIPIIVNFNLFARRFVSHLQYLQRGDKQMLMAHTLKNPLNYILLQPWLLLQQRDQDIIKMYASQSL